MTIIKLFVPGKPAPQGSKRHVGRGIMVESSREVGPWRERVALAAHDAMRTAGLAPFTGAIVLTLSFILPRPKSTPKRTTPPAVRRPDCDKLARAVGDALTHTVYLDDSQIVELHLTKRLAEIGETTGVDIAAEER
jgi:crossover junction endodeoxyribonuclease RusA